MSTATFTSDIVANASSYEWTVPSGLTIASGQGTSSIDVNISNTFKSGNIGVKAVSLCGSSLAVFLNERSMDCPVVAISTEPFNRNFSGATTDNINSKEAEKAISIFPNPTNGKNLTLTFEGFDISENIVMQLFDMTGKVIFNTSASIENIKSDYLFNIGSLPNGIYLIKISQDNQQWNNRLIISK
ncbi:MAG: T9SS type A sorting domain-containing protein [Bacteroidetes bacterium]|nr:T9SS type A sorting domain-containing protein [Bacteroidota bacterium]